MIKDWLYKTVYPSLAWLFMHSISASLRLHVIGGEAVDTLFKQGERLIFSFWHGRHFLVIHFLPKYKADVIVSPSQDGALIANVLKNSGFGIIAGSSHKSPVRALVKAVRRVHDGANLLVTVDGPKGPIYKVKPGAVYVAKKSGAWIVPITFSFKPVITMRSWDQYKIPFPFSKTIAIFGKPYQLDKDVSQTVIDEECERLEAILTDLTNKADKAVEIRC